MIIAFCATIPTAASADRMVVVGVSVSCAGCDSM
jgi:hypothetical protein